MDIYERLIHKKAKLAVVGLGYVGLPIAIEFAKNIDVIGFDYNSEKINRYRQGIDPTNEVGNEAVKETTLSFSDNEEDLGKANFFIIAVPTPINQDKTPDLTPVINASEIVARNMKAGSIVVYESTVYPGVTEEICAPILEKNSGLKCGKDFKIGYSPERINPGDRQHRLSNIRKIVSGMDSETLEEIAKVYEIVIQVGVYRVSSLKVAEAAKVVENSQRDINIAFMNELAMVFDRMEIDTNEVVDAMNTKWNALGFRPGLVGGHCIGVDPYYFVYGAENLGYHSQIIASGRKVNDGMGGFIADQIIKKLVLANKAAKDTKVYILGLTFKEDCPDIRNSKVEDIILRLEEYGFSPIIVDPWADRLEVKREYGFDLIDFGDISNADCLVFSVAHSKFKELSWETIEQLYNQSENRKILIDVKGIFERKELEQRGYDYWRL